jgi:hypothetical protein
MRANQFARRSSVPQNTVALKEMVAKPSDSWRLGDSTRKVQTESQAVQIRLTHQPDGYCPPERQKSMTIGVSTFLVAYPDCSGRHGT